MSGRLVGEVHAWLRSPAARELGLTVSERMVLSTIAERAHEATREMWSHRGDDCSQFDYLREVTGLSDKGLTKALNRLADRGLETRIQIGETRSGRPVFACRGVATRYRLPELPASIGLPERPASTAATPVDNPGDNPTGDVPLETDCLPSRGPIPANASPPGDPIAPNASPPGDPSPSKDTPYKDHSLTPLVLSSHLNLEGPPPAAEPPPTRRHHMGWDPNYRDASRFLQTLPDLGGEFMARAEQTLPPGTPLAERVIYAARIAHEGIPA